MYLSLSDARQLRAKVGQFWSLGRADQGPKLVDDLPLFSAEIRHEPKKPAGNSALDAAVDSLVPDEMTPREALETLYRLKGLVTKPQ